MKLQDFKLAELVTLPYEDYDTWLDWANQVAGNFWDPLKDLLQKFLQLDPTNPFTVFALDNRQLIPADGRWHRFERIPSINWVPIDMEELPDAMVLDFESCREAEDSPYRPFLAIAYGNDNEWYGWTVDPTEAPAVAPFPKNRLIIGHNVVEYDRRFLSSEYEHLFSGNQYIDTLSLATCLYGLGGDDGHDKDNEMIAVYKKFRKDAEDGKPVPAWYSHACTGGLKELCYRLLGVKISKEVRDNLSEVLAMKLYGEIPPYNVQSYCAQDVFYTFILARELFTRCDRTIFSSPISWVGMGQMSQAKAILSNWDSWMEKTEEEVKKVKEFQYNLVGELIDLALKSSQEHYSQLDWKLSPRSKIAKEREFEFPYKWLVKVEGAENPRSLGLDVTVYLSRLMWDGVEIDYRKKGRSGTWWAGDVRLPHPSGQQDANIGSPYCTDYLSYAQSGRLTSKVIPQETLIALLESLGSITQWTSYKKRYKGLYRLPTKYGEMSVCDVVPAGTVTRRSTSPIWVVLPKSNEDKIGSDVMSNISAPPGFVLCGADFDAQELGLIALLTDAQVGKNRSSEWTKAIIDGDKDFGTDVHSLVSKNVGIPRNPLAKNFVFCSSYGGGKERLTLQAYAGLKGKSIEDCRIIATDFLTYLKGPSGVAKTSFATLKRYSSTPGIRTMILGVKIPESLDCQWAMDMFHTTRNNWNIQSAGVDLLHTLLVVLDAFLIEYEVEAYFFLSIHDAVYFYVKEGQEELFEKLLQSAHYVAKQLAYEQARIQALRLQGVLDTSMYDTFECPENALFFKGVKFGKTLGDL